MSKLATRPRRTPQRTCISCRTTTGKRELVRIVRTPEGRVVPDQTGKAAGRGAYLCTDPDCWTNAAKKRLLERSLKVTVSQSDIDDILNYGKQFADGEVA